MSRSGWMYVAAVGVLLAGCDNPATPPVVPPELAAAPGAGVGASTTDATYTAVLALGERVNQSLAASGADYRVGVAHWLSAAPTETPGRLVFFKDVGNQGYGARWVPGDPRRFWNGGTAITYIVDQVDASSFVDIGATTAAIERAMTTWDNVQCSDIPIVELPGVMGLDLGVAENGGIPIADITHAGWMPVTLLPPPTLGLTITFFWIDPSTGDLSDINHDGYADIAFSETYYADWAPFAIDDDYDVETVALHESGHDLGQDHFGGAFGTYANGKVHFSPRTLMSQAYSGIIHDVDGSDLAGHCGIWGSWPLR